MIKSFDELVARLRRQPSRKRVAVVAAQDEHTLEAVVRAHADGLVDPVLLGEGPQVRTLLDRLGAGNLKGRIEDITDATACAERACQLARAGEVDCIMKGGLTTGTLMKVLVNRDRGIRAGGVMSIAAFMESPHYHKLFVITDVGLLTYPNKAQKRGAIENAVGALHRLGIEKPKVAMLAAVEKVNPKMPETVDADEIKREGIEGAIVEGPISYDLAMDREAARLKGYESPVAGDADILAVPDIVSGNIAAKTITVIGGGRTGGCVLGGLVPILLVSRAASVEDKYLSIVVSALVGGRGQSDGV